jgi:hypothetical protein
VVPSFLSGIYEKAIHAGNGTDTPFVFTLRGEGVPTPKNSSYSGSESGGADQIYGDVYVNGDVSLYEQSRVYSILNTESMGDVDATGVIDTSENEYLDESISGTQTPSTEIREDPDLVGMDYETINTHNVGQIFTENGINSGRLPSDHELYDVLVKNPFDRSSEISGTDGDDYFLEPDRVFGGGTQKDATDNVNIGDNRIYYIDGDLWVHNKTTYGFLLNGISTFVVTGDIHISDNLAYANDESLLGLVALGKYNEDGTRISGGNIYFGDPRYGTTYTVSGLMFAAHDFLYNTDSITGGSEEPETGFSVFGNFAALNQVSVNRDWYSYTYRDRWGRLRQERRPAYYDTTEEKWYDLNDGSILSENEFNSLRHYQMKITYDDRVRTPETQPPGLPRGVGSIFAGLISWEEIQ